MEWYGMEMSLTKGASPRGKYPFGYPSPHRTVESPLASAKGFLHSAFRITPIIPHFPPQCKGEAASLSKKRASPLTEAGFYSIIVLYKRYKPLALEVEA